MWSLTCEQQYGVETPSVPLPVYWGWHGNAGGADIFQDSSLERRNGVHYIGRTEERRGKGEGRGKEREREGERKGGGREGGGRGGREG